MLVNSQFMQFFMTVPVEPLKSLFAHTISAGVVAVRILPHCWSHVDPVVTRMAAAKCERVILATSLDIERAMASR